MPFTLCWKHGTSYVPVLAYFDELLIKGILKKKKTVDGLTVVLYLVDLH